MENEQNKLSPEYLIFQIEKEFFTLDASGVLEVVKHRQITEIPRVETWLPGIINLRGNLISVIDLAMILGMEPDTSAERTWFVICEAGQGLKKLNIAIPVTSVEDVIRIHPGRIEPPPEIGMTIRTDFIRGSVRYDNDLLLMLDMDKVVSHAEKEIARICDDGPVV